MGGAGEEMRWGGGGGAGEEEAWGEKSGAEGYEKSRERMLVPSRRTFCAVCHGLPSDVETLLFFASS